MGVAGGGSAADGGGVGVDEVLVLGHRDRSLHHRHCYLDILLHPSAVILVVVGVTEDVDDVIDWDIGNDDDAVGGGVNSGEHDDGGGAGHWGPTISMGTNLATNWVEQATALNAPLTDPFEREQPFALDTFPLETWSFQRRWWRPSEPIVPWTAPGHQDARLPVRS